MLYFRNCVNKWCLQAGTDGQYTKCNSASSDGKTCYNPQIRFGSTVGGRPVKSCCYSDVAHSETLLIWCKQMFPKAMKGTAVYSSDPSLNSGKGAVFWNNHIPNVPPFSASCPPSIWCQLQHYLDYRGYWKDVTNPFKEDIPCDKTSKTYCVMTSITCE